jgi:hypothetical protein
MFYSWIGVVLAANLDCTITQVEPVLQNASCPRQTPSNKGKRVAASEGGNALATLSLANSEKKLQLRPKTNNITH